MRLLLTGLLAICAASAQQVTAILDATSGFTDHLAPGSRGVLIGNQLADTTETVTGTLPVQLPLRDGSVLTYWLSGTPMQLVSWSPTRVEFIVPESAQLGGRLALRIERRLANGAIRNYVVRQSLRIRSQALGISPSGTECGAWETSGCADARRLPRPALTDAAGRPVGLANPMVSGGAYTLWITGLGNLVNRSGLRVTEQPPTVVVTRMRNGVNGPDIELPLQEVQAEVYFAGGPASGGTQVNFSVPPFPAQDCRAGQVVEMRFQLRPAGIDYHPAASNSAFAPLRLTDRDCLAASQSGE